MIRDMCTIHVETVDYMTLCELQNCLSIRLTFNLPAVATEQLIMID